MITEKEFSQQIETLFRTFGWRYSHFRPARTEKGWRTAITGDKGFPDYVAVRNGLCLFVELKSDRQKLRPEQEEWMDELAQVAKHSLGIMVFTWRPKDIEPNGGKIVEVLR